MPSPVGAFDRHSARDWLAAACAVALWWSLALLMGAVVYHAERAPSLFP